MNFVQMYHQQQKKIGIYNYVVVILKENVMLVKVIVVGVYILQEIHQILLVM
jgi:hypothetical protein